MTVLQLLFQPINCSFFIIQKLNFNENAWFTNLKVYDESCSPFGDFCNKPPQDRIDWPLEGGAKAGNVSIN